MSKRALKKYLKSLNKRQLEEQMLDLYNRFHEVKTFYNFVFNPKEDKLVREAKFKISKEYFPLNNRKPKTRRSIAQKLIKHFMKLGVAPHYIIEVMVFNIEIAQQYSLEKENISDAFVKSMYKSFEQLVNYSHQNGVFNDFKAPILQIVKSAEEQRWPNSFKFESLIAGAVQ